MIYALPYYLEGFEYEKDFDQQDKYQKKKNSRLPRPDGLKIRPSGAEPAQGQRKKAFGRIIAAAMPFQWTRSRYA